MPLMLYGHAHNDLPVGNWLDMSEDGKGLWAKGQLDLDDPISARLHRALKQKRVRGLSIGYATLKSRPDQKQPGITHLDAVDLWEVSIVNFPANRRARVEAVKSEGFLALRSKLLAGDRPSLRELEKGVRDAFDLSNSEAERAVRTCFKEFAQGEPETTTAEPAARMTAIAKAAAAVISIRK